MKRILLLLCGIAAASWVTPRSAAQTPDNPRFTAIASLAEEKMREYRVPGVALGIVENGTVTIRGLGVTSVEDPLPVTAHTVFPIASISKTFAATAMMRLVEQGKVDLRAPVRKYLPDFRVQDEAVSRDVTIWHLLTHTSGWEGQVSGPDRGEETLKNFVVDDRRADAARAAGRGMELQQRRLQRRRTRDRSRDRHSRSTARCAIWCSRRSDWRTPARRRATSSRNRFALGHADRGEQPPTLQRPFSPSTSVTAGGVGLCMTDLLAYARFHLGDGTAASGERVLTRASLELMRTPQLRKQSTDDDIGIAWHLRTVGPIRAAAHGGTLGGHILLLEIVPERNFAIGDSDQREHRLAADSGRRARGAEVVPGRDVRDQSGHRAPRARRDAARRRAAGDAAGSGAVRRPLRAADECRRRPRGGRRAVRAGRTDQRQPAAGDARRVLRSGSRGRDRRDRSRPVDRVRPRRRRPGELDPRHRPDRGPNGRPVTIRR